MVDQLTAWLSANGVDTSSWGGGKAKSVDDLKKEIEAVETTLRVMDGRAFRCVSVVKVVVRQSGRSRPRYLMCQQQTMADGRVRERNLLPSCRIHEDEAVAKAAVRCLVEELGGVVQRKDIAVQKDSLMVRRRPCLCAPALILDEARAVLSLRLGRCGTRPKTRPHTQA
jgi:hypothetical protein